MLDSSLRRAVLHVAAWPPFSLEVQRPRDKLISAAEFAVWDPVQEATSLLPTRRHPARLDLFTQGSQVTQHSLVVAIPLCPATAECPRSSDPCRSETNVTQIACVRWPSQEWDAAVTALVRCAWADPLSSLPCTQQRSLPEGPKASSTGLWSAVYVPYCYSHNGT